MWTLIPFVLTCGLYEKYRSCIYDPKDPSFIIPVDEGHTWRLPAKYAMLSKVVAEHHNNTTDEHIESEWRSKRDRANWRGPRLYGGGPHVRSRSINRFGKEAYMEMINVHRRKFKKPLLETVY